MPTTSQMRWFVNTRFNRIIGRLAAQVEIERPLLYLNRLPLVPAFDDELTGRFTGKILMADLIADDQEAVVQESMTLDVVTNASPNIKHGQHLGQKLLNRIDQLSRQSNVAGANALRDWDAKVAANLLLGVRWRMNALACAMMIDSLSYNRLGIQITNATWGMPSDLKVTVGTAWSNVSATPISDVLAINQTAGPKYGISYDKITMSTTDFRNMVATTEFANKATLVLQSPVVGFLVTPAALRTRSDTEMQALAGRILNMDIELDNFVGNVKQNNGTVVQQRALPIGTVLLSRKQDENNGNAMDMANGIPTESLVAGLVGGRGDEFGQIPANQYGPIGYYTRRPDRNPPDITAWSVARAFPRKFIPESTAVLNGV